MTESAGGEIIKLTKLVERDNKNNDADTTDTTVTTDNSAVHRSTVPAVRPAVRPTTSLNYKTGAVFHQQHSFDLCCSMRTLTLVRQIDSIYKGLASPFMMTSDISDITC